MSLQVQSSQPAQSGRRTPHAYQVPVQNSPVPPTTATPPTNGNNSNKTAAGKLSLKASSSSGKSSPASSGKASPATVPAATPPAVTPQKIVVVDLVDDEKSSTPVKPTEKVEATNGSAKEAPTNGKHEEVKESPKKDVVKSSPKVTTTPKSIPVEQVKTPETVSPKKKDVAAPKEAATPAETAPKKKVDSSLVAEKTLKGFTAEGDEMESLVVEPSEYEDSPMPPRTGGKSKLLKGGPPTRARISPFRVALEATATANASTVVNLSTVSEGQNAESNESSPALDFNRPLRAISGRRSTRPLTEIQFSHRKPSAALNDSSSSLDVTVGSEIHNDSLRTPAGPGSSRKRKAMTPESTSDALDVKEHTDSPKRTRLDFSGFLGIVASPVTMLKNRFSRVRLHASTPVAKRSFDSEEDLVGKVVTAEATTTTANISGGATDQKMEVDADKKESEDAKPDETTLKEGQTEVPAADAATASEDASTAEEAKETDTVEVKDVTDKQRRCVIM